MNQNLLNLTTALLQEIDEQEGKKQWQKKINQLLDELKCTQSKETFEKIQTLCDFYELQNFETFKYFTKNLLLYKE